MRLRVCATCGTEYESDALFCPKDGTPLGSSRTVAGADPYLGLVIGGQIEVRKLIGIGTMGRVYLAYQRGVERDVALKVLHRDQLSNRSAVIRFVREAKISGRLIHPNVVQVVMAGQLPELIDGAGGEQFIVMEYLDGISLLSALAAAGGALPLPRALHILLQVCDAVGEAHAQGVVHRDLKPANVMLVRRGDDSDFAKVLDFGLARMDWGEDSLATQAGTILGTAKYISPEGALGKVVGASADVYSIATILYECLSGKTPFEAESPVALLMKQACEEPVSLSDVPRSSYVPQPLVAAVMRNLSKSPEDRSADGRAFGRELVDAARAGGLSPDDLVPRSTLLGQRTRNPTLASSFASSFVSIQRTKQMELSPKVAERIGAKGVVEDSRDQIEERAMLDSSDVPAAGVVDARAVGIEVGETGVEVRKTEIHAVGHDMDAGQTGTVDEGIDDDVGIGGALVGRRWGLGRWVLLVLCVFLVILACVGAYLFGRDAGFGGVEGGGMSGLCADFSLAGSSRVLVASWGARLGGAGRRWN
ncbi:MAG: serine/threonine protein kinase [Polyangiaceae bacterium]|nr:serine/threonine protein kinase [Polyangiaceae bacterium]